MNTVQFPLPPRPRRHLRLRWQVLLVGQFPRRCGGGESASQFWGPSAPGHGSTELSGAVPTTQLEALRLTAPSACGHVDIIRQAGLQTLTKEGVSHQWIRQTSGLLGPWGTLSKLPQTRTLGLCPNSPQDDGAAPGGYFAKSDKLLTSNCCCGRHLPYCSPFACHLGISALLQVHTPSDRQALQHSFTCPCLSQLFTYGQRQVHFNSFTPCGRLGGQALDAHTHILAASVSDAARAGAVSGVDSRFN